MLSAIEYSGLKIDYAVSTAHSTLLPHHRHTNDLQNAPTPAGRNASGCAQKIGKVKKALKNDIEALKAGLPVGDVKAKGTKGKRKADDSGEGEKPKKRGRPKKVVKSEPDDEETVPEFGGADGEEDAEVEV